MTTCYWSTENMGKKTEAMPEAEEPEISDYELVRLENIRRNDARLGLLGLGGAKSVQAQLSSTGRLKRRCRPAHTGPVRSSGRERKRSTRLPVDSPTDARRASGANCHSFDSRLTAGSHPLEILLEIPLHLSENLTDSLET